MISIRSFLHRNDESNSGPATQSGQQATTTMPAGFQWETLPVPSDEELGNIREKAVEVIPQRTTEEDGVFQQTAEVYHEVHQKVVAGSKLGLIRTRLEEAMKNGKEQLLKLYADACAAAQKDFVDICLPHVEEMANAKSEALEKARALREENERLEQKRADYCLRLTGDPDIKVPDVNTGWLLAVSLFFGSIVTVVDAFLGAPSFSFGSNDIVAYTMSFALGFSLGAIVYFWATAQKRLDSFVDAVRALELYKARHPRDLKVKSIQLLEPTEGERGTVGHMKSLFILVSVALFLARIYASKDSSTMMVVGLMATIMIIVVSLVGFFIEKRMAPPYGAHHAKLAEMDAVIDSNDEEIDDILNPNPEEGEPEWLAQAKSLYEAGMNIAWAKVDEGITAAHGNIANYRSLLSQSREFSEGLREQHTNTCLAVMSQVLTLKAEREGLEKIDYSFDKARAASALVLPAINDPFTAQIESGVFNPEEMRPARIAAEPNKVLHQLILNAPKPQEAPKPRRPIINITSL